MIDEEAHAVVVVDDEADILWILGDTLEAEGFQVLSLDHPDLTETLDPEAPPALFVLDLALPSGNGLELARSLREAGFGEVPMIAISAHPSLLDQARRSGLFWRVLTKPFETADLMEAVRSAETR